MKSYLLFIGLVLLSFSGLQAQTSKDTTISFRVEGNCGSCKSRIEKSIKINGVIRAGWDAKTKMITVTYLPEVIAPITLHEKIAAVGHATELVKASESAYESLPECCLYRTFSHDDDDDEHESALLHQTSSPTSFVTGKIFESVNGHNKPLAGASVVISGSSIATISNADGSFLLENTGDNSSLLISYVGYPAQTVPFKSNDSITVVFSGNNQLAAVVVTASKRATYVNTTDPVRMSFMTNKELLKAACCNLSESFETNPSVDVSFNDAVTGSKQIQLLGLAGNYTQLTVENMPGPRGLATPLGLSTVPGTWVESIQLIKGPGSVVNGFESIAGQINVEMKKPEGKEKLLANVYVNDWGKTDINLNSSIQLNKRWSTAFLLHDAFGYNKVDFNNDGFRDAPTGNLFTAMNRWHYGYEGMEFQFGGKIMTDRKMAGQTGFNSKSDLSKFYGVEMNTDRYEGFAKIGYVFPSKPYQSVGLQVSGFDYKQDAYFGHTDYKARQKNFYSNFIFQSAIGSTIHKYKLGLSFQWDDYNETLKAITYKRKEIVPGAFAEYTFTPNDQFALVAATRVDNNNLYGTFITPRFHLRYEPVSGTVIRLAAGRGQRTANIFAENNGAFVSARTIEIINPSNNHGYGLEPEVAWNKGISLDQKFRLFNRQANIGLDFYRNDFENQVVVDLEDPSKIKFYNLTGKSFSNSFQAEVNAEPVKALTVKLAYRYFDVQTTYGNELLQKPFTAPHRVFTNLAYEVNRWKFDYTLSYNGRKRITQAHLAPFQKNIQSPDYFLMNAQVTKTFGKKLPFDVYVGAENITNFYQEKLIVSAQNPFDATFDASQIWGPVGGRMFYAGVRLSISK